MAHEIPGKLTTLIAAADLSSSQYRFVDINNAGKAAVPAAGARCVGIVQNKPKSGEAGTIMGDGDSKLVASAAIAAGALVTTTNDGRGKTAATGEFINGRAKTAAGGAGEIFTVTLLPGAAAVP